MVIDYVICLFIITYIEDVLYTLMCMGGILLLIVLVELNSLFHKLLVSLE